jgi:hypothetical protein
VYQNFTPAQKLDIKREFLRVQDALRGGERRPVVVRIYKFTSGPQIITTSRQDDEYKISAVLKDSQDSYVHWRYLFMSKLDRRTSVELVFHRAGLRALCIAVDNVGRQAIAENEERTQTPW